MLVAIAERESVVRPVMIFAQRTIPTANNTPLCPTTWPKRKNIMTPRMVNVQGVKTPPNVPNLDPDVASSFDRENKNQFLLSVQCASKYLHLSNPMNHKSRRLDRSRPRSTPLDASPVSRSLRRNPVGQSTAGKTFNSSSYIRQGIWAWDGVRWCDILSF